jgi:hypothetical protein
MSGRIGSFLIFSNSRRLRQSNTTGKIRMVGMCRQPRGRAVGSLPFEERAGFSRFAPVTGSAIVAERLGPLGSRSSCILGAAASDLWMQSDLGSLVDLIYEAALIPELWPSVLAKLSKTVDGAGGLLFTSNLERIRWTASPEIRHIFEEFIRDGWAAINPRPKRIGSLNYSGFIRDNEHFSEEELENDPVYRDFLRKRGLGWAAGTLFNVPSGDSIIFSFEKAYEKGPVDLKVIAALDNLRPHLGRSALLASRLGLERARAMTDALATIGLPAAVLRGKGTLLAANSLFEAYISGNDSGSSIPCGLHRACHRSSVSRSVQDHG